MKLSILLTVSASSLFVLTGTARAGAVPPAPEAGGPRNSVIASASGSVNLRESASASANVLARYAPGTVLDNVGGCVEAQGRVWCDVQQLGGGARGYVAHEFLRPAISPDGTARTGEDDSALRAGEGKFDATGKVPCAQHAGQPMAQCDFGAATSEADGYPKFSAAKDADLNMIKVGDERYEIPDAVVLGG